MAFLANDAIAQAVLDCQASLKEKKTEHREAIRVLLVCEEVLLRYQDYLGAQGQFELRTRSFFGKPYIEIKVKGEAFDPFCVDDENDDFSLLRRLQTYDLRSPSWSFRNGTNRIKVPIEKKARLTTIQKLIIAMIASIVFGVASLQVGTDVRHFIGNELLDPIYTATTGLILAVSGPFVFFSILWTIISIGDTSVLSKIGKRIIARFAATMVLIGAGTCGVCLLVFQQSGESGTSFKFRETLELVLDVFPDNLVGPFVTGHTLQLVFLAVVTGVIILGLSERVQKITDIIEQVNIIVVAAMDAATKLIPIIVFISIFRIIAVGDVNQLKNFVGAVLLIVVLCIVLLFIFALVTSARRHVSVFTLVSKIAPVTFIALSTVSTAAAMPTHLKTAREKLGINEQIADFGIPLGQVVFRPGSVIVYVCYSFGLAAIYGVAVTPQWIVMALFMCVLLSCSAPPVNGSAVAIMSVLLSRLGIPAEAFGIAIAADMMIDSIATATNATCATPILMSVADDLDMLDHKVLSEK